MRWPPEDGFQTDRYPDGAVRSEGVWKNRAPEGPFCRYHLNGNPRVFETWKDGVLNGPLTRFFESGGKMMEGGYCCGHQVGRWQEWHENGQLRTEGDYRFGRKAGAWPVWDKAGVLVDDGGPLPLRPGSGLIVVSDWTAAEHARHRLPPGVRMRTCVESFDCGPLCSDLAGLGPLRDEWWLRSMFPDPDLARGFTPFDKGWAAESRHAAAATWVEIWVGPTLRDQTLLAAVAGLRLAVPDLSVRSFGAAAGKRGFLIADWWETMGSLPDAVELEGAVAAALVKAWDALSAPTPAALARLVREGSGDPARDRALAAFLDRYPERSTGLGSLDRRLLRHCRTVAQKLGRVIAHVTTCDEGSPDHPGDMVLHQRLVQLGRIDPPLVAFHGDPAQMRDSECALTDFGAACLAGQARATEAAGWHDRIGGVTLTRDRLWYREDLV